MATVGTSTNTNPVLYPGDERIDIDVSNSNLYVLFLDNSANPALYRSINNGGSWSLLSTLTRASIQELTMYVSLGGIVHIVYRTNESSQDRIYWRRYSPSAGTWSAEVQLAAVSNGGVAGAVYTGVALVVVGVGQSEYVAAAVGTQSGGSQGVTFLGATGKSDGTSMLSKNTILNGQRIFLVTGTGRIGPTLDLSNPGHGKPGSVPHLWATFGRTSINMMSCTWTGAGWTMPTYAYMMVTSVPAQNSIRGTFDGRRYLCASANPSQTDTVAVYERSASGTGATTKRTSPAHTTGVIRSCSISYDYSQDDFRVYAVGTSTPDLYYTTYDRSAGTWSSWTLVVTTDILGSPPENYSVRRNAYGNARFDVVIAHSGAPNTVVHYPVTQAYSPSQPVWQNTAQGVAASTASVLDLDWSFVDVDPNDTQTAYALRRQIGAGAFNYWRASDSTWQVAEVKNFNASSFLQLASGWASPSDATYSFAVKTWDSTDLPSIYSTALQFIPSTVVNPTITAPTNASTLTAATVTATWTVSEQSAFRVQLIRSGTTVHDSGYVTGTQLSYALPVTLDDNTSYTLQLNTKNLEGLVSANQQVTFTTDFVEPAQPTLVFTTLPSLGVIRVDVQNPAPAGSEPAVLSQDLYRRETVAPLNSNPYATTNTTGWTLEASSATSFTRSTAQAHEGPASFLLTANGTAATAAALHDAFIPVDALQLYEAGAWVFCPVATAAGDDASIGINWYDAANALISQVTTGFAIPAGRWTYVVNRAAAPSNAVSAKPRMKVGGTPPAAFLTYFDEIRFGRATADEVRIAAGVAEDAIVDDWRAAAGVSYEYRTLVRGVNGTASYGPWTV